MSLAWRLALAVFVGAVMAYLHAPLWACFLAGLLTGGLFYRE